MEVIEALRTSILEPHDHLHINQMSELCAGRIRGPLGRWVDAGAVR